MSESIVMHKCMDFAVRVVRMYQWVTEHKHERILTKQFLRSGTSVGANVKEAMSAQSTPDFIAKLYISLKEARETEYWLELLHQTDYINQQMFDSMIADNKEIIKLLTSIIMTTKNKKSRNS